MPTRTTTGATPTPPGLPVLLLLPLLLASCRTAAPAPQPPRTAHVSCGQCHFGLDGPGCELAVRLDGGVYLVDGAGIDDFGDAHAPDGLCNAVRPALVSGGVTDGRFHADSIELLPTGH